MASGAWISQQNVHYNNWNTSLVLSGTSSWMVCSHNHILICLPYRLMGNKASSDQILTGLLQYWNGVSQDKTRYWRLGVEQGCDIPRRKRCSCHSCLMLLACVYVASASECNENLSLTWDVDCSLLDSTRSCYGVASPEGPEHLYHTLASFPGPAELFVVCSTWSWDIKMSSTLPVWLSSIYLCKPWRPHTVGWKHQEPITGSWKHTSQEQISHSEPHATCNTLDNKLWIFGGDPLTFSHPDTC